jgi:hypothetical protein
MSGVGAALRGKPRPLRSDMLDFLSKPGVWIAILIASAIVFTILQTCWPSFNLSASLAGSLAMLCVALSGLAATFAAARRALRLPGIATGAVPWVAGLACLLLGWLAGTFWPNSGDEHSYLFLADTLLAGRLTNPPAPDPELFSMYRVFTVRGETFSQYLPGWPMVLAIFRSAGLAWIANPVLTTALGVCLLGAMRRLRAGASAQLAILLLVLLSPFTLFNGASFFSGTLSAALAAAIAWQHLVDEEQPTFFRKALIGVLFGLQLLTRVEMFLLIGALYAADRLWRRRQAALGDALPVLLGALPFVLFLLAYDHTITGDAFQTPVTLTNPDLEPGAVMTTPRQMITRSFRHAIYWTAALGEYGGLVLLFLQFPALAFQARRGALRFFDLALPATILLFLIFPYEGGHQYGPRYWFSAWPLAALTIASGYVRSDASFIFCGRRLNLNMLTAANLLFCFVMLPGLILTTRVYVDARRAVFVDAAPVRPAIVLLPSRGLKLWPWQRDWAKADSRDFARNDVDYKGPVLYGRLDVPDALARACRLPGRAVFIWGGPGDLVRQHCPPQPN